LDIVFDESQPIYTQIMKGVLRDIATGALLPGDKLFSVRDFAKQAKTNPNTVQRAYTELERIGVVETQRGQGTFVSDNAEIAREVRSEMTSSTVQSFVEEMRRLRYSDSDILALVSRQLAANDDADADGSGEDNSGARDDDSDGGAH
jgi:GntR family transcriptional regulator